MLSTGVPSLFLLPSGVESQSSPLSELISAILVSALGALSAIVSVIVSGCDCPAGILAIVLVTACDHPPEELELEEAPV